VILSCHEAGQLELTEPEDGSLAVTTRPSRIKSRLEIDDILDCLPAPVRDERTWRRFSDVGLC